MISEGEFEAGAVVRIRMEEMSVIRRQAGIEGRTFHGPKHIHAL